MLFPSFEKSPTEAYGLSSKTQRQKTTEGENMLYESTDIWAWKTVCVPKVSFAFRQRRNCTVAGNFWSASNNMVPKQKGEISKRSGRIKKRRSSCEDYGQQASQPIVQAFGNLTKALRGALILKLLPFLRAAYSVVIDFFSTRKIAQGVLVFPDFVFSIHGRSFTDN